MGWEILHCRVTKTKIKFDVVDVLFVLVSMRTIKCLQFKYLHYLHN